MDAKELSTAIDNFPVCVGNNRLLTPEERKLIVAALHAEAPQLPAEPTHRMLKALAGDPAILAASDEAELRKRYADMLKCED